MQKKFILMVKFSIIIPLFNKENFICRAVNCVLAQKYHDFELIIVDDGSTDNSLKLVSKIVDNRIKIITKKNGGVSSARNAGIDVAANDWICFLDADDYWLPNHLEEILLLLNKYPEAKIYSTITQEKSTKGINSIQHTLTSNFEGYIENYFLHALKSTIFNSSSVCINKNAIENVGLFDTNLTHGEDLDAWFKLVLKYKGAVKSINTVIYDLTSENRAMNSLCSLNRHLLSKINSFRNENITGLNNYIDYFILRNSVPYYFSKYKNDVISIILPVKERNKLNGIWKYLYSDKIYLINLVSYKLYKNIKTVIAFI